VPPSPFRVRTGGTERDLTSKIAELKARHLRTLHKGNLYLRKINPSRSVLIILSPTISGLKIKINIAVTRKGEWYIHHVEHNKLLSDVSYNKKAIELIVQDFKQLLNFIAYFNVKKIELKEEKDYGIKVEKLKQLNEYKIEIRKETIWIYASADKYVLDKLIELKSRVERRKEKIDRIKKSIEKLIKREISRIDVFCKEVAPKIVKPEQVRTLCQTYLEIIKTPNPIEKLSTFLNNVELYKQLPEDLVKQLKFAIEDLLRRTRPELISKFFANFE